MELIMTVETRKTEIKNVFNDWKKKRFSDRDVLKITERWRHTKCKLHKTYPFGENRSNVWNHEWTEQFLTYSHNEWNESNSLTNLKSYWTDEVCNLISRHEDDFDSEEVYESRLNECLEISNKYN